MNRWENTRLSLVVTADDFGLSKMVNEGIVVAFKQGVVRNTALLVNFSDVGDAVERLQDVDGLDVGIHLNLTSGPPVLKPKEVSTIVGKEGTFLGLVPFVTRVALGRIEWSEVQSEWEAQIELGLKLGCKFTSISGHQHVHMLPQLTWIVAALATKYGIPVVRLSRYRLGRTSWVERFRALVLMPASSVARRVFQENKILHNEYTIDTRVFKTTRGLIRLDDIFPRNPGCVYEVVCHPGYVDDTLKRRDRYTIQRVLDLEVLTSPQVKALFERDGMELTTYRALLASKWALNSVVSRRKA